MDDDLNKAKRALRSKSLRETSTQQTQVAESPRRRRSPTAVAGLTDCLVIIYSAHSSDYGKKIDLNTSPITIGRDPQCEVRLEGDIASRTHCQLVLQPAGWQVEDLASTNGTYINDELVEMASLLPGDLLRVGHTIFKYLSGSDVEAQYHETIYQMTISDGLTGAYNKRFFLEALDKELSRSKRYQRPLCIVMTDIDHFKFINDTYGHLAGDTVLKEVSQILRRELREEDIFARFGGEEFAIILPETSIEAARLLVDRMRLIVKAKPIGSENQAIEVTFSAGIAERKDSDTVDAIISRADERLYRAKRSGRDQVIIES